MHRADEAADESRAAHDKCRSLLELLADTRQRVAQTLNETAILTLFR
jgi:hypothetical protein